MVGRKAKDLDERVGYYGEMLVLLAQVLGLNTCWVGLSYRKVPGAYHVGTDEKLVCVIALGYGVTQGVPHRIKRVEDVSRTATRPSGPFVLVGAAPPWFTKGVEAALLAPTAVNQQKFTFEYVGMRNNRHLVRARAGFSLIGYTRIDLGIAKCHFELGAATNCFDWV